MRDTLGGTIQPSDAGVDTPPEAAQTRRENHLSLSSGEGGAVSERDYRLITRAEEQISDPPWFDGLKTALMMLLIVLLLALPFVPFILLNRRAGQAQAIQGSLSTTQTPAKPSAPCSVMSSAIGRSAPPCRRHAVSGLPTAVAMPETYRKHYRACVDTFLKLHTAASRFRRPNGTASNPSLTKPNSSSMMDKAPFGSLNSDIDICCKTVRPKTGKI
ncbi:MAG: hypothetical protein ACLS7Z_13225 [Christensenellales bacterium]